jgi:6-pyruvoyl-tetrahydropterin synthase
MYVAYGGWRRVKEKVYNKMKSQLSGKDEYDWVDSWDKDKKNRPCNENCCNYLAGKIKPFVSANAATSFLTENQIYDKAKSTARNIRYDLMYNYLNGNSYELKIYMLGSITSGIRGLLDVLLSKAKDGATSDALTQTVVSTFINRNTPMVVQNQEGIVEGIQRRFGFGGKK